MTPDTPYKIDETRYYDDGRSLREIRGYRNQANSERSEEIRTITSELQADGSTIINHRFSDHPLEIRVAETVDFRNLPVTLITFDDKAGHIYDVTMCGDDVRMTHNRRTVHPYLYTHMLETPFDDIARNTSNMTGMRSYMKHLTENVSLYPEAIVSSLQKGIEYAALIDDAHVTARS